MVNVLGIFQDSILTPLPKPANASAIVDVERMEITLQQKKNVVKNVVSIWTHAMVNVTKTPNV
jgi:hypothetical protein